MNEHAGPDLGTERLGLISPICRCDFLNGVLLTTAGLLLHGKAPTISPEDALNGYGGVGDYAHSNGNTWEVLSAGHAMRDGYFERRVASATVTGEIYDLVAVVGGISGLAAAIFFQKYKADARSSSTITRSSGAKSSAINSSLVGND
jgi:spermidine dehydrogenase